MHRSVRAYDGQSTAGSPAHAPEDIVSRGVRLGSNVPNPTKLPAVVAPEQPHHRAQQGARQQHQPMHRLPPLRGTIGGAAGSSSVGNDADGEEQALFLTHGFFSPPRNRVLLYSEMPASVSALRNALRQQHAASASEAVGQKKSPLRRKSVSPHRRNSKRTTSLLATSNPPEFPFFGERVQPTTNHSVSSQSSSASLAHKAFVDMPREKATSMSHVHLLHHEWMDYEDDLVYATFEDESLGTEKDVMTSYTSSGNNKPFVPATTPYALLANDSRITQRNPEDDTGLQLHHIIPPVDEQSSLPATAAGNLQPPRVSLWAPASAPNLAGQHTQRTFVLPSTLVRFTSEGADEAQRHHIREQRENALEELVENQRKKAILAALAVGPEQLAAPKKELFLRCRFHDTLQDQQSNTRALHKAVLSALLQVCVFDPLVEMATQQQSSAPLPLLADATPVFPKDGSTFGPLQRHTTLTERRARTSTDLQALSIADQSFVQQVKKLVTLRICDESYTDPRALAADEVFVSISSPSNTHKSLIERVALSIQHTINTGQHAALRSCQFVDCPFEHEYPLLKESPRVKEAEENAPLPPEEEGWSIEAMPPRKGKWEEYAATLLASMVVPTVRVVHAGEDMTVHDGQAGGVPDAVSSNEGSPTILTAGPSQRPSFQVPEGVVGASHSASSPCKDSAVSVASPEHEGSESQPLVLIMDVSNVQQGADEGFASFQAGAGRRSVRHRGDSMLDTSRRSESNFSSPTKRGSFFGGGDSNASAASVTRRSSKFFGGAVKDQRLKRLNSISLGGQELSRIISQVESGIPISTDLIAGIDRDGKSRDKQPKPALTDATLSSSTDSLDDLLNKHAEKDSAAASVTSDPGASAPINLFGIQSAFQTKLKWVSATKPVPAGSIITGRAPKQQKARKLALDDIVKQRLESLFVRYGLDVHPKPGALSEQSQTTLRRCAGCIFDRPHAFCTQCGYLFCIDCFYFIHRPRNETFTWYAAQHPGRLRAMVTTEFMSEGGNDFRHAALSIDSLFRSAKVDESTTSSEMPVMASAACEDVTASTGRTARKVLERFRQMCVQDPNHIFAQVSGGGLTDEAFRLSIHNVLAQLEERLRISCNAATPSAEFAKLAHSPVKKLPPKKKKAPISTSDEHKRLITDALDAFAPSQISHLLEVIAKFQLRVPPQLHRLIIGVDESHGSRGGDEPPTSARGLNSSLAESLPNTADGPPTARGSISYDNASIYSGAQSSTYDEAGMSGSGSSIARFEEDDELESTTASSVVSPGAANCELKSQTSSDSLHATKQRSAVEKKYEALRSRKKSEGEAISLHYEDEEIKKVKRPTRHEFSRSPTTALPQHLVDAVSATADAAAETEIPMPVAKAELQEPLLRAMDAERAAWFRRKLECLPSCPSGLVLIVSVSQFSETAAVAALPSARIEADLLCNALRGLGYSVDWMHNDAAPSFLAPTVANVAQHVRAIQDVVIANDETLSKRFTVIVYSRGFIAQSAKVFVGGAKNTKMGASTGGCGLIDDVASAPLPPPPATECVALALDTEFVGDGRLACDNVLTPTLLCGLKDQFDRSPVLLMDCWPMPNVHGALDAEGVGFGLLVGRASTMAPEQSTPPPQSPTQATVPSSATDSAEENVATSVSAKPSPTAPDQGGPAPTTVVPPLRLCFSYLPRQGGLLAYYFLRALDGRSLFSRVVVSQGTSATLASPVKSRRSTPQSKHRRTSQGISDNDVSVVDLFSFLSKHVETKGARFLADSDNIFASDGTDAARAGSPTSSPGGGGKKKAFLVAAKHAAAHRRGGDSLSPQRNLPPVSSPTRGLAVGPLTISIAKKREEIARNVVYTVADDGTLPVVSFPPEIANKMMQLSIANSGNPFADQKATETIFNLVETRRFHLTMLVRCDTAIGGSNGAVQDPSAAGGLSAAAALATSFEEDTAYNARWRRQLLSVFQAVFNGSRSITRNGRPAQLVGLRVSSSFVLDFGVGWCEDGVTPKQVQKLVEASVMDAERIVGMQHVFHTRQMTRSGVVAIECSNHDFRAVLLQTLAATERRSHARGVICPSPKVFAMLDVSLLGSERDYRRARKLLALQNMGSTGYIIENVTKDAVSEKLHTVAARIQAIFRAGKLRSFIRCLQELCQREERVRMMLDGQFNAAMDDVAIELHRVKSEEVFVEEEDVRLVLACAEVQGFMELVDCLNEAMHTEAAICRLQIVKTEEGEWLKLFEAPNRWVILDDEEAEWKMMLLTHKLNFREMWQRYYIVIEAYQDRVRLRTEARAFIVLLPRLIRIPSFWMVPPPCDFDFASSLVIFPPNFKALYMKAKRAIVDSSQSEGAA